MLQILQNLGKSQCKFFTEYLSLKNYVKKVFPF